MKLNQIYWAIVYKNDILEGYENDPFIYSTERFAIDMYDFALSYCDYNKTWQGHTKKKLLKSKIVPIQISKFLDI